MESDRLRRFLFEEAPVRGHWVHLSRTWIEAREHQHLPVPARDLLGQALAAVALLSASLKFTGTLTLQLSGGEGAVTMLVAQSTDTLAVRGMAQVREGVDVAQMEFAQLVSGGRMVVTVEQGDGSMPWQGIVPLDGASLAQCLERYFAASEQLPTIFRLDADEASAAGLMLQKLPAAAREGEASAAATQDIWEEAELLLGTVQPGELVASEPERLLGNLFAEHDIRLFDADPVRFACRCDRERVAAMLRSLGREEVESILAEQGEAVVTCEFCRKPYRFDAVDAAGLFLPATPGGNDSVN